MAGAPLGNQNGAKAKPWTAAIYRALEKRSLVSQKAHLDALAERLLDQCEDGNLAALQELGNRLEGKPAQSVTVMGDSDNPIDVNHKVEFVGAHPTPPEA